MTATRFGRAAAIVAFAIALVAYSVPAAAQSGQLKGRVIDATNKPVEGAKVLIEHVETARKMEVTTDKRGDYVQVGLQPGNYRVTASKGDMSQTFPVRLSIEQKELNFQLKAGATGDVSAAEAKKNNERVDRIKATFGEGAALTNEGKFDEAIVKFNAVIVDAPKCFDCYNNLGTIYSRQQQWDKAEEAFKKALEVNAAPNEVATAATESYTGLANVYNAQKKFKEAQEASAEATKRAGAAGAAGGGNPTAIYNAGVIAWNANDFVKANELFSQAITIDPNHAESHFMLGRVLINLGKLGEAATEFETYLKLAPTGPNAKEAKSNFDQLKQFRK